MNGPSVGRRFDPPAADDARRSVFVKGGLHPGHSPFTEAHHRPRHIATHHANSRTNRASNRRTRVVFVGNAFSVRCSATHDEPSDRQASQPKVQAALYYSEAASVLILEMILPFHKKSLSRLRPRLPRFALNWLTAFTNRVTPHWAVFMQELFTAQ